MLILNSRDNFRARQVVRRLRCRIDTLDSGGPRNIYLRTGVPEIRRIEMRISEWQERMKLYDFYLWGNQIPGSQRVEIVDFPEQLIYRRLSCQLSQGELAAKIGVNPKSLGRWERTLYASVKFSRLLQVDATLRQIENMRAQQLHDANVE